MAMILVSGNSRRRSWIVSMPSFSGMKMSVTITVAGRARCSSRPCAPFAAPSASMPWIWNHSRASFLKSSLSSMTRTRVICGVAENPTRDFSGAGAPCGGGIAKRLARRVRRRYRVWGFSGHRRSRPPVVDLATRCHIHVTTAPAASPVCSPGFVHLWLKNEKRRSRMNQPAVAHESHAVIQADEMTMILAALTQLKRGDAKVRLPYHGAGAFGKVAEVFNDLVEQSAMMADEVSRLSQVVGKEGKLKKRAALPNAHGFWADS